MDGPCSKGDKRISFDFGVSVCTSTLAIGTPGVIWLHAPEAFCQMQGLSFFFTLPLKSS